MRVLHRALGDEIHCAADKPLQRLGKVQVAICIAGRSVGKSNDEVEGTGRRIKALRRGRTEEPQPCYTVLAAQVYEGVVVFFD